jgi:hypothetical protein
MLFLKSNIKSKEAVIGKDLTFRIIRIVAYLQLVGASICIVAIVWLNMGLSERIASEGILAAQSLVNLNIYLSISIIISFVLFCGILKLKNWARILLVAFVLVGLLNAGSLYSPSISSFALPFVRPDNRGIFERVKSLIFILIDIYLLYFFTRESTREAFLPPRSNRRRNKLL